VRERGVTVLAVIAEVLGGAASDPVDQEGAPGGRLALTGAGSPGARPGGQEARPDLPGLRGCATQGGPGVRIFVYTEWCSSGIRGRPR
jgi:hypothetical protein